MIRVGSDAPRTSTLQLVFNSKFQQQAQRATRRAFVASSIAYLYLYLSTLEGNETALKGLWTFGQPVAAQLQRLLSRWRRRRA